MPRAIQQRNDSGVIRVLRIKTKIADKVVGRRYGYTSIMNQAIDGNAYKLTVIHGTRVVLNLYRVIARLKNHPCDAIGNIEQATDKYP